MLVKNEIWVLSDDRPGTVSQSIGLACQMGIGYKIIKLTYNSLANLPNCLLNSSPLGLTASSRSQFKNLNHLPNIIISAGRRSAVIALYLKKLSQGRTKLIQIMNPNLSFRKFDFVILPKHDGIPESQGHNLITTIGALSKISDEIISSECKKFSADFTNITKPKIALLLGGASSKTKFSADSAANLARISSKIAKKMGATLLILNSRRTGDELTHALKSNLDCDFKLFDWQEVKDKNPYLAILGFADFFIITGDSVSMISECCSTGKPVYVFDEAEISAKKHRQFHRDLFAENYARKLSENLLELENFSPKKLQETKRVANIITKFWLA
jgi:mitochondrial fission protein ELM1